MANDPNTTGTAGEADELDIEFTPGAESQGNFIGADADGTADDGRRSTRQALRAEAGKLGGQAGDRFRAFADDGKTRATGALDDVARMIDDAARTIDEKVGEQFGGYARNASSAVSGFADNLRGKEIDDLIDDARAFVRKSPGVAIGAAAAMGFVLARLLRSGVDANRDA